MDLVPLTAYSTFTFFYRMIFVASVLNTCTELKESNVNLKLTIVDTVGFGDQIDKTDRYV